MTPFEKMFHIVIKPWFILVYFLCLILVYLYIDRPSAFYFHQHDFRAHYPLLNVLTALGKNSVYFILFSAAALHFRFIRQNKVFELRAWFLLACILLASILGLILKVSLGRARPELLFDAHKFGFYGFQFNELYWSFPSGHTLTVVTIVAGISVLFPKYFYPLLGFALLVVISRVFLYFHYISDVMATFYLGLVLIGFFAQYFKKNNVLKVQG